MKFVQLTLKTYSVYFITLIAVNRGITIIQREK